MFEPVAAIVSALLIAPAMLFAARRSSWLVDYFLFVLAFNRGIRRLVDYSNGAFNPFSTISLTPLIIGMLTASVVLVAWKGKDARLSQKTRTTLGWFGFAFLVALAVGIARNKSAALYDFSGWLGAFGLMGYAALYAKNDRVMNRWATNATIIGVVVAVYGLFQYYFVPPWDTSWVRWVRFEGYLGSLESTKMTVFSTLAERGPAGAFFAATLIMLVLRPGLLGIFRWPGAMVVAAALLLTYVRTSVLQVVITCLIFPLLGRGTGLFRVVGVALFVAIFGQYCLSVLPSAGVITDRLNTLGSVQNDGSFQGRLGLLTYAVEKLLRLPLGTGFGSTGLGSRITGAGDSGIGDSTGYLELLLTFGVLGAPALILGLVSLWKSSKPQFAGSVVESDSILFRAWLLGGLVVLFSGNWLGYPSYFWVLAGFVLNRAPQRTATVRQLAQPLIPRTRTAPARS